MLVLSLSSVSCRPQNTREVLLRPFNLVRNTGGQLINSGSNAVNNVPNTINSFADGAVRGVQLVPQSVNSVSDFTVDSINAFPNNVQQAPGNAFRFVNNFGANGANAVRTVARAPGTAFTAFRQTPSNVFQSGNNFASGAVQSGTGFVRSVPTGVASGTRFVAQAPGRVVGFTGDVIGAGATGATTLAGDGLNFVGNVPNMAVRLADTTFRTGGAALVGGTRVLFATGDSLARTGFGVLSGGARVAMATAGSGVNLASRAFNGFRQIF